MPYGVAGGRRWDDDRVRLAYLRSDPEATGPVDETRLSELYRHPRPAGAGVCLRSNFVASLDGSITGADGRSGSLTTPADAQVFALHRAHADAVLVGAGTVRAEGYRAIDLAPRQRELRAAEGLADFPTLVVVSGRLELDPQIARPASGPGGPVVVITTERAGAGGGPLTDAGVEVVALGEEAVDLDRLIGWLAAAGLGRVLCEGGPRLHRDLLAAGLVDELSLTLAPVVVGGRGQRSTSGDLLGGAGHFVPQLVLVADDGTVLTRYGRASGDSSSSSRELVL